MSHFILDKYRSVKPVTDDDTVHKLLQELIATPREQLEGFFARAKSGRFYLYRHALAPGKVVEYVPGNTGDDSVTTLFDEHPIFTSRQALIDARTEILEAIERVLMAVPGTTVVRDEGREREVRLEELGTAQLIDTLAHFMQTTAPGVVIA